MSKLEQEFGASFTRLLEDYDKAKQSDFGQYVNTVSASGNFLNPDTGEMLGYKLTIGEKDFDKDENDE